MAVLVVQGSCQSQEANRSLPASGQFHMPPLKEGLGSNVQSQNLGSEGSGHRCVGSTKVLSQEG